MPKLSCFTPNTHDFTTRQVAKLRLGDVPIAWARSLPSFSITIQLINYVAHVALAKQASGEHRLTGWRDAGHDSRLDLSGYELHGTKIQDITRAMERDVQKDVVAEASQPT